MTWHTEVYTAMATITRTAKSIVAFTARHVVVQLNQEVFARVQRSIVNKSWQLRHGLQPSTTAMTTITRIAKSIVTARHVVVVISPGLCI